VNAFNYSVFGLKVRSSLALPELFSVDPDGPADVIIETTKVAGSDSLEPGLSVVDGALVLVIPEVGSFRISDGTAIAVDPLPGTPERNVRLFLLGSAFGALLHQRGLLPLHANAVEIDGKAVAFMGPSGAGKSTLAAWLHDRGYRVIADDVCVVGFDEAGRAYAAPGLPRLRLWAEALELMGRGTEDYDRSYVATAQQLDKFDVPIQSDSAAQTQLELSAVFLLDRADRFSVERLHGIEAADAIFANTYRGSFVSTASGQQSHWQSAVRLVKGAPIYRASRQWDLNKIDGECRQLLQHATDALGLAER
jgi:hypothetical protein